MFTYFATASGQRVREAMDRGLLGQIVTPAAGNRVPPGRSWCADNGAYTGRYPGDEWYLAWLARRQPVARWCHFATAPDVVGDARATLRLAEVMLPRIREIGYRAALCAQDGMEQLPPPWDTFDVLFVGGSTGWKLSAAARNLIHEARTHSKHVHMGRCNSARRMRYAAAVGCDSADGTYLAYGPDTNLPHVLAWLEQVHQQLPWGTPPPPTPRVPTMPITQGRRPC